MLKTSPVLSSSANASPTSFRHAPPSRSSQDSTISSSRLPPQQPPPPPSAPSPKPPQPHRRPSSRSAAAMTASASSSDVSMASAPSSASMAGSGSEAQYNTAASATTTQHFAQPTKTTPNAPQAQISSASAQASDTSLSSPNKRRSYPAAQGGETLGPEPSSSSTLTQRSSSPKSSKRAKPEEQPPKVLPQRYELCPVEDMVQLIAHMLGELIATNDAIRTNGGLTRFHSRTAPGISVRDYLHRLARHATLTPPLLLAMVYYIDRLCALYSEFTINTLTVHRFLITAATVAAKGLSDSFWNNITYARVGGVRVAELKLLELEFLYRVDWKIVPNPEVLVAYYQGLVQRAPGYTLESDGSMSDDEIDEEDEEDDDDAQQQSQTGGSN